jgi:hypothetical protein
MASGIQGKHGNCTMYIQIVSNLINIFGSKQ